VKHIKFTFLFFITFFVLTSNVIINAQPSKQQPLFADECEAFNLSSKCRPVIKSKVTPKPIPKPARSNFIKDEVVLLYSTKNPGAAAAVTKKYNLKPKVKAVLGSVSLGIIVADTNGKNPLHLVNKIKKNEKQVNASTNKTFHPSAVINEQASNNVPINPYSMIDTGVQIAHKTTKGKGVLICMIDTPIDIFHPSFSNTLIETLDLIKFDPKDYQTQTHGTSVAGVLISQNKHIGIAPEAKLFSISAFSTTAKRPHILQGTSSNVAIAIDRCIQHKADVINLSFTGGKDDLVAKMVKKAISKGIVVVAAGGNGGHWGSTVYPALIPGVLAATAVDENKHLYAMANKGRFIDYSAPGVNVLTLAPKGKYTISTGTSLSTAHISGIIALLLSKRQNVKVEQVLTNTALDLGKPGRDQEFGEGLINVSRALTQTKTQTNVSSKSQPQSK